MSKIMKWFLDTEFNDRGPEGIELISIGLASETGKEYYAVADTWGGVNDWVQVHVVPKLGDAPRKSRRTIRNEIEALIASDGNKPEFWGYFADYDWVLFCQLWGAMLDLPKGWPHLCLDLKQEMVRLGIREENLWPPQAEDTKHHALWDAKWTRNAWMAVTRNGPTGWR
jgi:hypothetical protein